MWSATNRAISHYYITEVYGPNKAALVSVKVHICIYSGLVLWHCISYVFWCILLWWYITSRYCFDHSTFATGPRFTFKMFATHVKALTQTDLSSSLVAWFTRQTHPLHRMFVYLHLLHNWKRSPLFCSLLLSFMSGPHVWRTRKSHVNNFSEVVTGTIAWREITKGEYILWSSIEKYGSVLSCW